MKRYPVVIGATIAGLAGVLTFHSQSGRLSLGSGNSSSSNTPSQNRAAQTNPGKTRASAGPSAKQTTTAGATGALEQYGYGQLSVRVTMAGGKITNVTVATLRTADTYSQQLANQVVPVLQREVLASQSSQINALSGATYTSEAYAYSVQSALDKFHK